MPENLRYIDRYDEDPDTNVKSMDALTETGLVYRVERLSDGKVLRDSVWDLTSVTLFTGQGLGSIQQLHDQGMSWEDIFPAALEASCRTRPVDKTYD